MVKAPALMAADRPYFALMPVNVGVLPLASLMAKVSAGSFESGLRGSFRIFRVSVPVLVTVTMTLKFSTLATVSGAG